MKKFLKLKTALQVIIVTFAATALAVGIVAAATSISEAVSVGTDLTVTSGARIGTGSSGGHITALANDSLFVEGQSEFDGTTWFDGILQASSTLMATTTSIYADDSTAAALTVNQAGTGNLITIQDGGTTKFSIADGGIATFVNSLQASSTLLATGATTLYNTLTATTTSITANDGSATAVTINQQGAANLLDVQDSGTSRLMIKDGGRIGISSSTPRATLSVDSIDGDSIFFIASTTGSGTDEDWFEIDSIGDLKFDTNVLFGDRSTNRIGIGTSTIYATLSLDATDGESALVVASSTGSSAVEEWLVVDSDGDLVVDTDTLFVDNSADRVGIGSSTPFADLSVQAIGGQSSLVVGSSTATIMEIDATGNLIYDTDTIYGDWLNDRVGISTSSPAYPLEVYGDMRVGTTGDTTEDSLFVDVSAGSVGIASTTPSAMLSVGDDTGNATSTIDMGLPCFRFNTYLDGVSTEVYYWPCIDAQCAEEQAGGWATSTTSCF